MKKNHLFCKSHCTPLLETLVPNSKTQQRKTLEKLYCKYFFHIFAILKQNLNLFFILNTVI